MSEAVASTFEGLFAAVHTPIGTARRLDSAVVMRQYELMRESGVDGVFLCGTAGEGPSLTIAERRALLDTWVGVTEGAFPLIAHVGHNCMRDAVKLARHAARAGATAVASMGPTYYRPPSLEDLIEFLAPVAAATDGLPFFYYEPPYANGPRFATDQLLEWGKLRIPNLRGVKYASRDMATLQRCVRLGPEVDVLLGHEELLLPALACGVRGAVGVSFNFAAPVYRRIIEAFEAGDMEGARAEEDKALELIRVLREYGTLRASKAVMSLLGVDCGPVRLPFRPLTDPEFRDLHERVRAMDLFARCLSTPAEVGR